MPTEFSENALKEADASIKASQAYQPVGAARRLRSVENAIVTVTDSPYASEVYTIVKNQVNHFATTSKTLTSILDVVGEIHPFIKPAVALFKAGIQLELTRRENDDRVLALNVTMCDMMSILTILKDLTNPQGSDGISIEVRLRDRLGDVIETIKRCARLCDSYTKRHAAVKFFMSLKWQEKFAEVAQEFADHKAAIQFDLQMHASVSLLTTNLTLSTMNATMKQMKDDMGTFMRVVFERMRPPQEREIMEIVAPQASDMEAAQKEIEAAQNDDKLLERILERRKAGDNKDEKAGKRGARGDAPLTLTVAELRKELEKGVQQILDENKVFDQKLNAMMEQIHEVNRTITRESDRVIENILAGPHARIRDKDMYHIWKEMGWKGHVKASRLVLAIRDHFAERSQAALATIRDIAKDADRDDNTSTEQAIKQISELADEDEWALQYITLSRVQPLIEAIDDDGSSFVTIEEVNTFTAARPHDWSLPRWIAYWTYGHEMAAQWYFRRIRAVISDIALSMYASLPANRKALSRFVKSEEVMFVENLLSGLRDVSEWDSTAFDTDASFAKFKDYILECEERMERNLRSVAYNIDDENTLAIVAGLRRIEKSPRNYLLPLIFLLMRRSLYVCQQAKSVTLHERELEVIELSLGVVQNVLLYHVRTLQAVYKLQNLDEREQLGKYFHGLLSYIYASPEKNANWIRSPGTDYSMVGETLFPSVVGVSSTSTDEGATASSIEEGTTAPYIQPLYYGPQTEEIDHFAYSSTSMGLASIDASAVLSLIGHWTASYTYDGNGYLLPFTITTHDADGSFCGFGDNALGCISVRGTCDGGEFTMTIYSVELEAYVVWHAKHITPEASEIRGQCGRDQGNWYRRVPSATEAPSSPVEEREREQVADGQPPTEAPASDVTNTPAPMIEDDAQGNNEDTPIIGTFLMIRRSVQYICPSRELFKETRVRALWKLAIDATLCTVRSRTLTKKRLEQRREQRKSYIKLSLVQSDNGYFQRYEDAVDWVRVIRGIHPDDLRLWRAIWAFTDRRTVYHWVYCDGCGVNKSAMSTRFLCIECTEDTIDDTVDLCWTCSSSNKTIVTASGKTHTPDHHLLQLRWPLWRSYLHRILSDAKLHLSATLEEMKRRDGGLACIICGSKVINPPYFSLTVGEPGEGVLCFKCNSRVQREQPWLCERGAPDLSLVDQRHWWLFVTLVPVEQAPVEANSEETKPSLEDRMAQIEAKSGDIVTRLESLEGLVKELLASLTAARS